MKLKASQLVILQTARNLSPEGIDPVEEARIANNCRMSLENVRDILITLEEKELVDLIPRMDGYACQVNALGRIVLREKVANSGGGLGATLEKKAQLIGSPYFPTLSYFLYISNSKIDRLSQQAGFAREANVFESLGIVVNRLAEEGLIGGVLSGCPYFFGTMSLRWGVLEGGRKNHLDPTCIFFSADTDPIVFMAGSAFHLLNRGDAMTLDDRTAKTPFGVGSLAFSLESVLEKYLIPETDGLEGNKGTSDLAEYLSLFLLDRGVSAQRKRKRKKREKKKDKTLHFPKLDLTILAKTYKLIEAPSRETLEGLANAHSGGRHNSTLPEAVGRYALEKPSFGNPLVIGSPLYVAIA